MRVCVCARVCFFLFFVLGSWMVCFLALNFKVVLFCLGLCSCVYFPSVFFVWDLMGVVNVFW